MKLNSKARRAKQRAWEAANATKPMDIRPGAAGKWSEAGLDINNPAHHAAIGFAYGHRRVLEDPNETNRLHREAGLPEPYVIIPPPGEHWTRHTMTPEGLKVEHIDPYTDAPHPRDPGDGTYKPNPNSLPWNTRIISREEFEREFPKAFK